MTQSDPQPFVFVSHASGDVKIARQIVARLQQHGVKTWLAPDDVQPGREFSMQLEEAIAGCSAFIVILSDKANSSAFVRAETELAFGKQDIYPVRIADVQPASGLALFLRLKHWTDAFGPDRDANLTRLAETILRVSGTQLDTVPKPFLDIVEPSTPISQEEATRLYIGEKAPHFLEKWRRMDARRSVASFNFPAFLFGPFWLFYRKVFKPGMIVAAAAFVLTTFGSFGQAMGEKVILLLVQLISLAVAITIGIFGNQLYRTHVATQTALLNRPESDPQQVRDRLAMGGGTSPGAVIGLLAGLFVANFVVIAIANKCCSRVPDPVPYEYPTTPATEASLAPASPAATETPSESASPSSTIWSACFENDTSFEITFTINPDKSDSHQEKLNAGQRTHYNTYSALDPTVRFDSDATSGTNLVVQTAATSSVASADLCGRTYKFISSGDTVSLSEAQ